MPPVQTILHPTDFSDQSAPASWVARLIARACDARLIVLHVAGPRGDASPAVSTEWWVPVGPPRDPRSSRMALRDLRSEQSDPIMDYLRERASLNRQLHDRFERTQRIRVETRVVDGDAADEILRV